MDERTLHELIDTCRPDGDDLQQPDMAPLAARLADDPALAEAFRQAKQFDRAVGDAMDDVALPEGLQDRLLGALQCAPQGEPADVPTVERPVRHVWTRRRAVAASLAALAAAVLVVVGVQLLTPEPIAVDQLAVQADKWRTSLSSVPWNERVDAAPLETRPVPDSVLPLPEAWKTVPTTYDSAAVVYRLGNGRREALLFVFDGAGRESELAGSPPHEPQPGTGGWQWGIWQQDGLVFVLAVEGDRSEYRRLVKMAVSA